MNKHIIITLFCFVTHKLSAQQNDLIIFINRKTTFLIRIHLF